MQYTNRELIKQRIRDLGYTHAGVAKRAEISKHTLARITGDTKYGLPNPFTRKRLARVLEAEEFDLFPLLEQGTAVG